MAQPIRVAPGGRYGDRKALLEQQQAAPLPQADPPLGGPPRVVPIPDRNRLTPYGAAGVFSPSARPDEPATAGVNGGPGAPGRAALLPEDHELPLRAMYAATRHPALARLLARLAG